MTQTPTENGKIYAKFSPAEVQGALPKFATIMKLFPNALSETEII